LIGQILKEALELIDRAQTSEELEAVRVCYLGRKGRITEILRGLKSLPVESRRRVGAEANRAKAEILARLESRRQGIRPSEVAVDVTLPGRRKFLGHYHPITQTLNEILEILIGMGFKEELGPEIETDYYNFEALNIPKFHPARDMFQSFYLTKDLLLRSHTSPVQIRVMEASSPPVRIVAPGRVYRTDPFDASHSPVFHQVEGLYVDEGVSFTELKGTLTKFCQEMFGSEVGVRFLPSYFPFTEPSAEVAISCIICQGKGCPVCKRTGWLEILGSGMVHPQVFKNVGYDPERYSGFAFGMGVERICMIKHRIDDIRLFYENDLRFLEQF
jgi:phenylalanyl-tRNA synthetase alpha chain